MASSCPTPRIMLQLEALLRVHVLCARRRRSTMRLLVELTLPLLLAPPLMAVRLLGGERNVSARSGVDRAVHLDDPFATKYAARLCTPAGDGGAGGIFAVAPKRGHGEGFRKFLRVHYGQSPRGWPRIVAFDDSAAIEEYVADESYGEFPAKPPLCGALIFDGSNGFTVRLNGTIAGNQGAVCGGVDTRRTTTGRGIDARATSHDWYLCSGFLSLQRLATEFLLQRDHRHLRQLDLHVVPFPTAAYQSRAALEAAPDLLGLSAVLMFAYKAGQVVGQVVSERESKLLEAMKLVGLCDSARLAARMISHMPVFALYGLEFACALHVGVFTRSAPLPLALFLVTAALAIAAMALSVSPLFDSSRAASLAALVGIFGLSRLPLDNMGALLLPPIALMQGLSRIVELEVADVGLRFSNVWDDSAFHHSMGEILTCLGMAVPLYLVLWWYLDRVVPHTFGVAALPWYRPWAPDVGAGSTSASGFVTRRRVFQEAASIVEDSLPVACAVEVDGIRKEYMVEGRGKAAVVAVRHLDLGMAEGEILALLGHNGAGKSTAVAMLIGALQPTRGKVCIYGFDVSKQPMQARRRLGVCPQHDVLFDDLTAAEHLHLAAVLRGVDASQTAAAEALMRDVGLCGSLATNTTAGSLSAGRRRVLDVALTFVGEPRFIVLDEPTSGMDPFVRRTMWDLLKKHRLGRVLCFSTHYMDEAEMLGDHVCILSRGAVQCYGSPDWLKVRLGSGYMVTLTRADGSVLDSSKNVLEVMQKAAPRDLRQELAVASSAANEVVIRVAFRLSGSFPQVLRALDAQKVKLGFSSLSVSATTLEELFLRLADGEGGATTAMGDGRAPSPNLRPQMTSRRSQPAASLSMRDAASLEAVMGELSRVRRPDRAGMVRQSSALLLKRWQSMQRNRRSLMCLCLLPLMFNVLGLASIAATFELDSPPLELLGTAKDLNPRLDKAGALKVVVPYTTLGTGRAARLRVDAFMQVGVETGLWHQAEFLDVNRTWRRATSSKGWLEDLQIDAMLVGGEPNQEQAQSGGPDMSKYAEMKQKGAPDFVIKAVMEKDGLPRATAEQFVAGGTGGVGTAGGGGGWALRGRFVAGLRDQFQLSADSAKGEIELRVELGRRMLRVDASRPEEMREELATCAAGGPAQAAAAEEAVKQLDNQTRQALQAMRDGGAPTFAQRAYLEQAGVSAVDTDILTATSSAEHVPPVHVKQLNRCSCWQAFAAVLLNSTGSSAAPRYGAFYVEDLHIRSGRVAVFYNASVFHSAPLFVGLLQQATLMDAWEDAKRIQVATQLKVTNWPLPLTKYQRARAFSTQGFSFITMSLIGASFLPAGIAADVSRELSSGIVRQQVIAGMSVSLFVLSSFVADVILVLPPLLSQIWFISAFRLAVFVDCLATVATLLLAFGLAAVAQVYALLPDLKNPAGDQNAILALNVVTGFILALITWILFIPFLGSTANTAARCLAILGRFSPAYNLANALLTIPNTALSGFSTVYGLDPLHWRVAGEPLFALVMNFLVYLYIAVKRGAGPQASVELTGSPAQQSGRPLAAEVEAEKRLAEEACHRCPPERGLVLKDLAVAFPAAMVGTVATPVRGDGLVQRLCIRCGLLRATRRASCTSTQDCSVGPLSLLVPCGGVLGLLGISGSGKSVLLAAVAGALPPAARVRGQAHLDGRQLLGTAFRPGEVGYCPQENGLSQGLSVYEQVVLFGRLRGLRRSSLREEVRCLLRALDLDVFEFTRSENLSGGNHRKLQCACAMIGSPKLICLDEPSTGLDPVARRALWSTVQAKLQTGSVVFMATKCISEAEALFSKLVILNRDGEMSTIGTAQETQNRYGGGHELRANLRRPTMADVYDSIAERQDREGMAGFLGSCVQALGGTIEWEEDMRALAWNLLGAGRGPRKPYTQCVHELLNGSWAGGLAGVEMSSSTELLPEDSKEMRAELDLRSKRILSELRALFPGVQCVEAVSLTRVYQLHDKKKSKSAGTTWNVADVFQSIEDRKEKLKIADYSITQASLEHVFNLFALRDQAAERARVS